MAGTAYQDQVQAPARRGTRGRYGHARSRDRGPFDDGSGAEDGGMTDERNMAREAIDSVKTKVGLLGAEVTGILISEKQVTDVRLAEIERRILLIEAAMQPPKQAP